MVRESDLKYCHLPGDQTPSGASCGTLLPCPHILDLIAWCLGGHWWYASACSRHDFSPVALLLLFLASLMSGYCFWCFFLENHAFQRAIMPIHASWPTCHAGSNSKYSNSVAKSVCSFSWTWRLVFPWVLFSVLVVPPVLAWPIELECSRDKDESLMSK